MDRNDNNSNKKLDILIEHAFDTNKRLDAIDKNLAEHMKRSELLEAKQEILEEDVKPMLEHFKGFKIAASLLVGMITVMKFLEFFKH